MGSIKFYKYSGNGNDFIILDDPGIDLTKKFLATLCDRHFGVGADGVLLLTYPKDVDGRMQIFNADGGEAEMCGNGLRCAATFLDKKNRHGKDAYKIQTMNSIYEVIRQDEAFAIEMSEIKDKNKFDISSFKDFERSFFINTGVPHLVFLVSDVHAIDIKKTAPKFRFHSIFPNGTNVSFVQILSEKQTAYVRTYERGVEDETFSCGTGLTATGLALSDWLGWNGMMTLQTKGGTQKVVVGDKIYYSGEVKYCFEGEILL